MPTIRCVRGGSAGAPRLKVVPSHNIGCVRNERREQNISDYASIALALMVWCVNVGECLPCRSQLAPEIVEIPAADSQERLSAWEPPCG